MNLAIYTLIGCAFVIALYVLGFIVEIVCALISTRDNHRIRRSIIVFGDTTPLRGKYTPPSHCDVQRANESFVKHNP